jgi:hypothetical protein
MSECQKASSDGVAHFADACNSNLHAVPLICDC